MASNPFEEPKTLQKLNDTKTSNNFGFIDTGLSTSEYDIVSAYSVDMNMIFFASSSGYWIVVPLDAFNLSYKPNTSVGYTLYYYKK